MAKNHIPEGFNRECGYKSDLEVAEERGTRVNTSFGSQNHNVYIHNAEHTHEHFWYDPQTGRSGYHGQNVETRNNHPDLSQYVNKESVQETLDSGEELEASGNLETGLETESDETIVNDVEDGLDEGEGIGI